MRPQLGLPLGPQLEVVVDRGHLPVEQEVGERGSAARSSRRSSSTSTSARRRSWNVRYHSRSQWVWGTTFTRCGRVTALGGEKPAPGHRGMRIWWIRRRRVPSWWGRSTEAGRPGARDHHTHDRSITMRRAVLAGVGAAVGLAVAACGPPAPPPVVIGPPPAPPAAVQARWSMNETTGRVMKDSVKPPHDGADRARRRHRAAACTTSRAGPMWSTATATSPARHPGRRQRRLGARHRPPAGAARTPRSRSTASSGPAWPPPARCPTPRRAPATTSCRRPGPPTWAASGRSRSGASATAWATCCAPSVTAATCVTAESADPRRRRQLAHLRLPAQRQRLVGRRGRRRRQRRRHHPRLASHPVERFSTAVTIGKKPGSTDPSDSFSGWLDELNISAG